MREPCVLGNGEPWRISDIIVVLCVLVHTENTSSWQQSGDWLLSTQTQKQGDN